VKNLFVGNLSYNTTADDLRSVFESYGKVDRVNLMTDRETGRSRGFAFIEMTDEGEAEKAIAALNGSNLDGRKLNVNEARPRPERDANGGSRGRSGGFGGRQRESSSRRW
jgi:RNA recognition motif-containing protein